MRIKPTARLESLAPQMVLAAVIVRECYAPQQCTITSANDSTHSAKSLHYTGDALDFRTHGYVGNKHELVARIKDALGPEFDVLLEGEGTDNEHVHVEFQP